jgi:iron complex outermembrane recepter protein
MRHFLLASLLLCIVSTLSAQSVLTGKVSNRLGSPVPGATVSVLNSTWNTVTDSSGRFSINAVPAGRYVLVVSSVGFSTSVSTIDWSTGAAPLSIILIETAMRLDQVVVNAQKREEVLQRVPISVSALGTTQLREYRIWHNNEITGIVPNLYSAHSGDDRNVTAIRGIATTSYDPAVATYIDGVNQFGLDTYIANLVDAERIEVLRGPQGTLYGRNAMGGVINIITKQPGNTTSGSAEINIGNYAQQRYSVSMRTPLVSNRLYFGVAGVYQKRDGFYKNEFNNSSYDKQQSVTGNYYLKFLPAKNWAITANVKHHNNRNSGAFPLVFGVEEAFENPYKLMQNATAKMIDNTLNASLSVNYTGRSFNFSSQTAYQTNHRYYNAPLDGDFSPIDGVSIINDYGSDWNKVKVFTQEIKFTSPATASRVNWTAGAYFFHQDNPVKQATYFGSDADLMGVPDENFSVINTNKGKSTGIALFGQVGYNVTDKLQLIAGIRADHEKKDYSVLGEYQKLPDPVIVTTPDTSASVDYNAISPKIGLSYQLAEDNILYATYSRGFRTGGFTQLSTDPSQPPLYAYKPEYSNNFEAGSKNSFFGNRLRVNGAFFYTQVNDAQVPTLVLPDAITVIRNAGELRSFGAEVEISATINNLQLDLTAGATDAEYTTLKVAQQGTEVNLAGKKQIFTPATTGMFSAQYTLPLSRKKHFNLVMRGAVIGLGTNYFDLANTIKQSGYVLTNVRAGFTMRNLEVFYWGMNVGNRKYIAYAYDFGAVHLGDPGTHGVTVTARF